VQFPAAAAGNFLWRNREFFRAEQGICATANLNHEHCYFADRCQASRDQTTRRDVDHKAPPAREDVVSRRFRALNDAWMRRIKSLIPRDIAAIHRHGAAAHAHAHLRAAAQSPPHIHVNHMTALFNHRTGGAISASEVGRRCCVGASARRGDGPVRNLGSDTKDRDHAQDCGRHQR
jgi:hypothetical protein